MYDPSIGRFLEEDPTGFAAEDSNLYRYVGNQPTNEIDPTGLVGVLFDGSGYKADDGTILGTIIQPYTVGETAKNVDRNPFYIRLGLGDLKKKVDAAEQIVLDALKKNPNEPVDIMGWSRGGIAALALVKRLEKLNITVRFLGLIDPTAPAKKYTEDKEFLDPKLRSVGANVQFAALLQRDGKNDGTLVKHIGYRVFFSTATITFSNKTKVLANKKFPINHRQTGFAKTVGEELWQAARKAGINLDTVENSPFREKEYNETPRGGTETLEIIEKLARRLKLLD